MQFTSAATQADIANSLMGKINALTNYDAVTTTSANSNQFIVTRNVTGTTVQDTSPTAVDVPAVSFVLDAAQTSTTLVLAPSTFDSLFDTVSNAGSYSRLNGGTVTTNTPVFSLYTTSSAKVGLALRVVNTGTVAFSSAVTVTTNSSNTAIMADDTLALDGMNNLIVAGTNIVSA